MKYVFLCMNMPMINVVVLPDLMICGVVVLPGRMYVPCVGKVVSIREVVTGLPQL